MLKDLSDQKKLEKELVLAAIQALKAKGQEVNAYTVADEAQISRSILYRNSELMELIAQEKGGFSGEPSTEELLKRIEELEDRNRELEEKIWDLEKQTENQHQEVWRVGYQAGMEEAIKRLSAEGRTAQTVQEPVRVAAGAAPTQSQSHTMTGEHEASGATFQSEDSESETHLSGNGQNLASHQAEPTGSDHEDEEEHFGTGMVTDVAFDRGESLTVQTADHPVLEQADSLTEEAEAVNHADSPAPHKGQWSKEGIYNAARSGPYVASNYNPLVELSWKDLETVYNFSVASLKDYAKNLPPPRDVMAPVSHESYPNQESMRKEEAPPAQEYVRPAAPKIYSQLDFDSPTDSVQEEQAQDIGQDPNRTADRLEAMDPRAFENVVDLDALDIFDDLDDYVEVDQIEIINDVEVPSAETAAPTEAEQKQSADELRSLIMDRIQQANEMPGGPVTPLSTPSPQGGAEAKGGGIGRSKFVGGSKAGQEAAPAPAAPFVVRQMPPEIRKACLILGVRPEEMTQQLVMEAWKKQIASPGVHPDQGGDTEAAIYLNTAKDTLVRWLDAQAPKLGKKFGKPPAAGKEAPSGRKKDEDKDSKAESGKKE